MELSFTDYDPEEDTFDMAPRPSIAVSVARPSVSAVSTVGGSSLSRSLHVTPSHAATRSVDPLPIPEEGSSSDDDAPPPVPPGRTHPTRAEIVTLDDWSGAARR